MFILGAGASMPFEFPSGERLVEIILKVKELHKVHSVDVLKKYGFNPGEIYPLLLVASENQKISYMLNDFFDRLGKSRQKSIDAFLEANIEFLSIGKFLIAHIILRYEKEEKLFANIKNHWLDYIWNKISGAGIDDFLDSNISFITYNYDRSLEHYLFMVIQNYYNISEKEAVRVLKSIPIVHLHGQLGYLPYFSDSVEPLHTIPYNTLKPTNEMIFANLENIKIIHENVENSEEYQEAWRLLRHSDSANFLGFGFHTTNLKRLKLKETISPSIRRNVIGSGFGLTPNEAHQIKIDSDAIIKEIEIEKGDNLDFLRNKVRFD